MFAAVRSSLLLSFRSDNLAKAAGLVVATGALGALLRHWLPILSVTSLFLMPVVVSALRWGLAPALLATVLGVIAGTLFYEPVLSVQVWTLRDIIDLCIFAVVAVGASIIGDGLRRSSMEVLRQQQNLRQLYALSREVSAAGDAPAILAIVAEHLSRAVSHPVTLLTYGPSLEGAPVATVPPPVAEAAGALSKGGGGTRVIKTPADGTWMLTTIGEARDGGLAVAAHLEDGDVEDGQPDGFVAQLRSILEEGARSLDRLGIAQAVEQRHLQDKTEEIRAALLDAASHELRTPLATVLGAATALAEAPAVTGDARLGGLTTLAVDECRRLDRVIQNILDASRIRSGGLMAHVEVVEASDLVQGAVGQARLRLRDHVLEVRLPADPPLVLADPVLIEHALVSVLENAAKFSPAGSPVTLAVELEGGEVHLRVSDTGVGFASAESHRLFDRFYRSRDQAQVSGTGLGLSVARAFVEASGGTISAHSAGPGLGATLTISLPQAPSEQVPDDDD